MKVPAKDLVVESVDPRQKFHHPPVAFSHLPQHEFSMMMVAPPGSGKTNLLCWMLMKLYKGYFNRVIVCSTTLDNDEKWNHVKKQKGLLAQNKKLEAIIDGLAKSKNNKKWKLIHKSGGVEKQDNKGEKFDGQLDPDDMFMDMDKIFPILKEQQDTIEFLKDYLEQEKRDVDEAKYLADRMLVILDDQAGRFDVGTNTPLNNFVIRHRHYSASVIIVTQAYKAIPRTIRTCMMQIVVFDIGSLMELKLIYEDRADCLDEKTWMAVYKYAVKDKPYSFLYFNYKFPPGKRFYKRFEKLIELKDYQSTSTTANEDRSPDKSQACSRPRSQSPSGGEKLASKRRRALQVSPGKT